MFAKKKKKKNLIAYYFSRFCSLVVLLDHSAAGTIEQSDFQQLVAAHRTAPQSPGNGRPAAGGREGGPAEREVERVLFSFFLLFSQGARIFGGD